LHHLHHRVNSGRRRKRSLLSKRQRSLLYRRPLIRLLLTKCE
jgi:hypothetical protein